MSCCYGWLYDCRLDVVPLASSRGGAQIYGSAGVVGTRSTAHLCKHRYLRREGANPINVDLIICYDVRWNFSIGGIVARDLTSQNIIVACTIFGSSSTPPPYLIFNASVVDLPGILLA
eukprot:scaffold5013_cov159-Amphora_coffeaeformis.AAC.2